MRVAILTVRNNDTGAEHIEKYTEGDGNMTFRTGDDVEVWAVGLIKFYNDTLRPHESSRTLVKVEVVEDAKAVQRHAWVKVSLTTQVARGRTFDVMRCERCGVTGKRFGLGAAGVIRDAEFNPKAFMTCTGAQRLLAKRKERTHGND